MADPELWHAIHRLAVVVKHMDVNGELGVEMDGLLNNLKKMVSGAKRSVIAYVGNNKLTPKDDYDVNGIGLFKQHVENLSQYKTSLASLLNDIKSNDTALAAATKAASNATKGDGNRQTTETEKTRLTMIQKNYTDQKTHLEAAIEAQESVLQRFREAYNEHEDLEYRKTEAKNENAELMGYIESWNFDKQQFAKIPPKAP